MGFREWLKENAWEGIFATTNDPAYIDKGAKSKMVAVDKAECKPCAAKKKNPDKLFGMNIAK